MSEKIEQYMWALKLGGMAREWRSVEFQDAEQYVRELPERNNKGTLNNFLENLKRVELIVVDKIGFVPLHKEAAERLLQVISDKSLIITSNLEFSQWNTASQPLSSTGSSTTPTSSSSLERVTALPRP